MERIGRVESLWRYPVKSMGGEHLASAFVGLHGIRGDRLAAIHDAGAPENFPYLTGRQRAQMLLFQPRFRDDSMPTADLPIEVTTPEGNRISLEDPTLLEMLSQGLEERHKLGLMRSARALTDAHPVSLLSLQTARQLGEDLGMAMDKRRFRANIYIDLGTSGAFREDGFVGHSVRIGDTVVLAIVERDPRCKMITLDPDTAAAHPEVIKRLAKEHQSCAGVYATVLIEGEISSGDAIYLLTP